MLVLGQLGPEAAEDAEARAWEVGGRAALGGRVEAAEDEFRAVHFLEVFVELRFPGRGLRGRWARGGGHAALQRAGEVREAGFGSYGGGWVGVWLLER